MAPLPSVKSMDRGNGGEVVGKTWALRPLELGTFRETGASGVEGSTVYPNHDRQGVSPANKSRNTCQRTTNKKSYL